jgi:uncharacterized protein (TIGR03000 family)
MRRQAYHMVATVALAVAALIWSTGSALAQHHGGGGHGGGGHGGGGHGGGGHGGGFHGGANHAGNWHGGGGHGGFNHPGNWHGSGYRGGGWNQAYYGRGWGGRYYGYRGYWPGYNGYGWYWPGYYGNGAYSPYWSDYWPYGDSGAYVNGYPSDYGNSYTQAPTDYFSLYPPDNTSAAAANSTGVEVRVPANAQVWFDGTATKQQGTDREFKVPPLEPGQNYAYQIRARWTANGRPMDQTREVPIHAGEHVTVNFLKQ